jgi:hypothetical protein
MLASNAPPSPAPSATGIIGELNAALPTQASFSVGTDAPSA